MSASALAQAKAKAKAKLIFSVWMNILELK